MDDKRSGILYSDNLKRISFPRANVERIRKNQKASGKQVEIKKKMTGANETEKRHR